MCRLRRDRTSCRFGRIVAIWRVERLLLHGGTDSSNLLSSTSESAANLTFSIRGAPAPPRHAWRQRASVDRVAGAASEAYRDNLARAAILGRSHCSAIIHR